jgi:hypothetical protein
VRLSNSPSPPDHPCVVVTRLEELSHFYNLEPFDNVDQNWQVVAVLFEGHGVFDISSCGCHAAFPFMHNVFQFALHGHVCWSSYTVAWDPDDRLHPANLFMIRIYRFKEHMDINSLGAVRWCCSKVNDGIQVVSKRVVLVHVIVVLLFDHVAVLIIGVECGLFSLLVELAYMAVVFHWSFLCMKM